MSALGTYYESFLRQHLEEVGDFRARYRRLLRARHASWSQLVKWEKRHLLHLEALRFSQESSRELARGILDSEWEEEVFGAAATLLACGEVDPVLESIAGTEPGARRGVLLDALFWHSGGELAPRIWRLFEDSTEPELRAALLLLLGRRREHAPAILQRALQAEPREVRAVALRVAAWLIPTQVEPLLHHALTEPDLEESALLALLELAPRRVMDVVRKCIRAGRHVESLLPALAAFGDGRDVDLLLGLLESPHEPLSLLGLGFHGSPAALPAVTAVLERGGPHRSLAAALDAYALLSGWEPDSALLSEPEEDAADDTASLSEEADEERQERDVSREKLRTQALEHGRGRSRRAHGGQRIRHGAPWSLARSLQDLQRLGGTLRKWTFRELAIHSGQPALADPESFHPHQLRALGSWAQRLGRS